MAAADLAAEWFETDLLRAVISARGIHSCFAGPWSGGTSVGLLLQAAMDGQAIAAASTFRGGIGALSEALCGAARAAGALIRTDAPVAQIRVKDERAHSVVLKSGEEIRAAVVVSSADPKSTFLGLVDPIHIDPEFLQRIRNYRSFGTVAKINYALSGLPKFRPVAEDRVLMGRIHIGPDVDYMERAFDAAKYGEISAEPYLDATIPSLIDPSLAPPGAHVMSVHAQFAPYTLRKGDWTSRRAEMIEKVEGRLAEYAPNFRELTVARRVLTPADLEEVYGLSGGHLLHGEQSMDQIFTMRPLLGWADYRTPIRGLYLCGSGTHPGAGSTGYSGSNAARRIMGDGLR
jgi:phytoene dehydrogenase-like protein